MTTGVRIPVRLSKNGYEAIVGAGILDRAGEILGALVRPGPAFVVTDANVAGLHLERLLAALEAAGFAPDVFTLPPGEETKTIESADALWARLLDIGADRKTPVVALGGGVVTDLAGFAAATFLRGVPWLAVPTSLLAQVDAAVGGKTGVTRPEGKNLVGAFHQPLAVIADVETLATLPPRHRVNGLAEVVKAGLGLSRGLFLALEADREALLAGDVAAAARMVAAAIREEAEIVAMDERDAGPRMLLNLGHTAGHAIEAATGFGPVLHGEAVAEGLVAATGIAVQRGILEPEVRDRARRLLEGFGLPTEIGGLAAVPDAERIAVHLGRDKKRVGGRLTLVLPTALGAAAVFPDGRVEELLAAL